MSKFVFLILLFLFYNTNAANIAEIEHEALVAVAKGQKSFDKFCADHLLTIEQHNELLAQKYKTFLGLLHFLRMNWNCKDIVDKVDGEFRGNVMLQDCKDQRKNVFILYEYLLQQHILAYAKEMDSSLTEQLQDVVVAEPNFEKTSFELIELIKKLAKFWMTFFHGWTRSESLYGGCYSRRDLKLLNLDVLVDKYNINFNESYNMSQRPMFEGIKLGPNSQFTNTYGACRAHFDEYMGGMEGAKKLSKTKNPPKFIGQPLYGIAQAIDDNAFLVRIKSEIDFEKLCIKLEEKNLLQHIEWWAYAWQMLLTHLKGKKASVQEEIDVENLCNKLAQNKLSEGTYGLRQHIEWATKELRLYVGKPSLEEMKKYLCKKYVALQYESRLGILHLWREQWHCDKILQNQKECMKHRKYVDMLYDYLLHTSDPVLAQHFDKVRPNFRLGRDGQTILSLIDVMNLLGKISAFFFDSEYAENYQFKWRKLLEKFYEPVLIEISDQTSIGERLGKLIGGLTKAEKGENSSSSSPSTVRAVAKQKSTANYSAVQQSEFDHLLKTMADTLQEKIFRPSCWGWLVELKHEQANDDTLLLLFLKNSTNFENLCADLQEKKLWGNIAVVAKRKGKGQEVSLKDEKETKEYLARQFNAYLGTVHLMRQKWNCASVDAKINKKRECEKFRKYLDILYEYLFREYVRAKHWRLASQFPPVKPDFRIGKQIRPASVIAVVESLCSIWAFFFDSTFQEDFDYKLNTMFKHKSNSYQMPTLTNEHDCEQMMLSPQQKNQKTGKEGLGLKLGDFIMASPRKKPANKEKGVATTDPTVGLLSAVTSSTENAVVDGEGAMVDNSSSDTTTSISTIESARNEFDGMLEGMTSAAKEEASTGEEGFFAKNKQLLKWLLD